jgi:hypothetical protein
MKRRGSFEPALGEIKDNDALHSIWSALEAEPRFLATRLRDGSASPEERRLAADLIEGNIKPQRPRRGSSRHQGLAIAEFVAFARRVRPNAPSKKVISLAREHFKDKVSGRVPSERYVYKMLKEFDDDALAHSERMYGDTSEREEHAALDPEESKRVRDALEGAGQDLLVEIIEGLLARE